MLKTKVYEAIAKEWDSLQQEFGIECPIEVDDDGLTLPYESAPLFCTDAVRYYENGLTIIKDIKILIVDTKLSQLIIENMDNVDGLEKYLETSLRHEMGHVLEFRDYMTRYPTSRSFGSYQSQNKRAKNKYEKWILNEWDGSAQEQVCRYYTMIPSEVSANKRVGISIEDIIRSEIAVNTQYIILRKGKVYTFKRPRLWTIDMDYVDDYLAGRL